MGRKGVSKRKPNQTKSKPFSSDKAGSTVSSVLSPMVSQPAKSTDAGKNALFLRPEEKIQEELGHSGNSKRKSDDR